MSADNWRMCPNCDKIANDIVEQRRKSVMASYGKVSPEEFAKALVDLEKPTSKIRREETLREDYEVYPRDGVFHVSYSASCDKCGFEFHCNHTEPFVNQKRPR